MTTLEERRHQADMAMVYKVLTGKDQADPPEWFTMAGEALRATRTTADPLNIRVQTRPTGHQEPVFHSQSNRPVEPGPK